MTRLSLRAISLAALLALCLAAGPSAAEDQLVYTPLVTDGAEYRRISYPQEAGSLVVLADTTIVLDARSAPVAYWPITREYLVNLAGETPAPDAALEIVSPDGSMRTVDPEPYLVWHADGVGVGPAEIIQGSEVDSFYAAYVTEAREAAARAQDYQRVVAQHQAAVEAWIKLAAGRPSDLPPPPPEFTLPEPEPYRGYASEPVEAAIVSLPAGSYTIRLRDGAGAVVPGSERALVSIAPLATGIGYVVRPQDRWTQPAISFAPSQTIYTTGKTDLFVQPLPVAEYEAEAYARLFRPQSIEASDATQTIWIPTPAKAGTPRDAALTLFGGSEHAASRPMKFYRVAQIPGRSRGYTIEEFTPRAGASLQPDFQAMRIGADDQLTRIGLSAGDGTAIAVSERAVRQVDPPALPVLFLPALLPLALALILAAARRVRRSRRGKAGRRRVMTSNSALPIGLGRAAGSKPTANGRKNGNG